jgi:hypothetical protein
MLFGLRHGTFGRFGFGNHIESGFFQRRDEAGSKQWDVVNDE